MPEFLRGRGKVALRNREAHISERLRRETGLSVAEVEVTVSRGSNRRQAGGRALEKAHFSLYMYECACVHITCTCRSVCVYILYTCTCMSDMSVCVHTCTCMSVCVHTCTCMSVCVYTHTYICLMKSAKITAANSKDKPTQIHKKAF
jgi:hypothetical protein